MKEYKKDASSFLKSQVAIRRNAHGIHVRTYNFQELHNLLKKKKKRIGLFSTYYKTLQHIKSVLF